MQNNLQIFLAVSPYGSKIHVHNIQFGNKDKPTTRLSCSKIILLKFTQILKTQMT